MAKFTSQEVSALQEGGNQVCCTCMFTFVSKSQLSTVKNPDVLIFFFYVISFHVHSMQGKFTLKSWIHSVILFLTAGHSNLLFTF